MYDWSELLVQEQRPFSDVWNSIKTYSTGNIVYDFTSNSYYSALSSVPANTPVTNGTYWLLAQPLQPLTVPRTGQINSSNTTYPELGTIFKVSSLDIFANQFAPDVNFTVNAKGVNVWPLAQTGVDSPVVLNNGTVTYPFLIFSTVFILYRQPYPGFATDQFVSGTTYNIGDQVFSGTDTYTCTVNGTTAQPPSANWTLVPFPYFLSEFVKRASYCDALVEDGQHEKAQMELPNAYSRLWNEYDKQNQQQGLTQYFSVVVR